MNKNSSSTTNHPKSDSKMKITMEDVEADTTSIKCNTKYSLNDKKYGSIQSVSFY